MMVVFVRYHWAYFFYYCIVSQKTNIQLTLTQNVWSRVKLSKSQRGCSLHIETAPILSKWLTSLILVPLFYNPYRVMNLQWPRALYLPTARYSTSYGIITSYEIYVTAYGIGYKCRLWIQWMKRPTALKYVLLLHCIFVSIYERMKW